MTRLQLLACCTTLSISGTSCTRPPDAPVDAGDGPPASSSQSAREPYRLFAAHITSGDIDALLGLFSEDATYRDRTFGVEVGGRQAIRRILEATLLGFGTRRMEIRRVISDGDTVVIEWVLHGVFSGPILGVAPDGQPIELEGVSIGIVTEGRIVEQTDYLDRAALEARLGLRAEG